MQPQQRLRQGGTHDRQLVRTLNRLLRLTETQLVLLISLPMPFSLTISCPAADGTYLSCCFENLKSETGFCSDKIDNDNDGLIDCDDPQCFKDQSCILKRLSPQCAKNKVCKAAGLQDLCCPTKDGVYLTCCKQGLKSEAGFCADGRLLLSGLLCYMQSPQQPQFIH